MDLFDEAIATFGGDLKRKLTGVVVQGNPEEQLRPPVEAFIGSAAASFGHPDPRVHGEVRSPDGSNRYDFVVSLGQLLCGVVELKSWGKGGNPSRYRGHDKRQAERLLLLPNVVFTDAEEWTLWQGGELVAQARLDQDLPSAGTALRDANSQLRSLLDRFFAWQPQAPTSAPELARISARLCRVLRESVLDEMIGHNKPLEQAATDWRQLLFPDADNAQFADGYAQAVTFGLLIARATGIDLSTSTVAIAAALGDRSSLIGRALLVLSDAASSAPVVSSTIDMMRRVLGAVEWSRIEKSGDDAWLYFYEQFLAQYDPELRKATGSYYTPASVVTAMTRLTDEALVQVVGLRSGITDDSVVLLDPAMGTGTFLLEAIRSMGARLAEDFGPASAGAALAERIGRLVGFELQLGPYAVSQLRLVAELVASGADITAANLRTYVADTLSNPYSEQELLAGLGQLYEPIAASRRAADKVKRDEPVIAIIGNPPYKDKAKTRGGWVETGTATTTNLFSDYMPPEDWGLGTHARHLYNSYVYFWRWAEWKAFEQGDKDTPGVVSFITAAAWTTGDGFQQMRAHLRESATDIYVIHCTPEGHQPPVSSRIFPTVQHEIAIVIAVRRREGTGVAQVKVRSLPAAPQAEKFAALEAISLRDEEWLLAPDAPRAEFLPRIPPELDRHPRLSDLFGYGGTGVMIGRAWPVAPDPGTLSRRASAFFAASTEVRRDLMLEGSGNTLDKVHGGALGGLGNRTKSLAEDDSVESPIRYAVRSLDRQWIIPDKRIINRPNPNLWGADNSRQLFLTAPNIELPWGSGPSATLSADVPDAHHYAGRGGRVYPRWLPDGDSNLRSEALELVSTAQGRSVDADMLFEYVAGLTTAPAFTRQVVRDWGIEDWRVPVTSDPLLFDRIAQLGRKAIAIYSYGAHHGNEIPDASSNGTPRMPTDRRPSVSAIPSPSDFPDKLTYDSKSAVLRFGEGRIDNVSPEVREFSVDGVNVLDKWFSYRRRDRSKPDMGRRESALDEMVPASWLSSYTEDLVDLVNALALLVSLASEQEESVTALMLSSYVEGLSQEPWTTDTQSKKASTKTDPSSVPMFEV